MKSMTYILKKSIISNSSLQLKTLKHFTFCPLLVCYFLQVPFRPLAKFISVFALLFAILTYKDWLKLFTKPIFCFYGLYVSICIFVAGFHSNIEISRVLRFTEILLMIPLFFCIDESKDSNFYSKSFIRIAFLKAIVLFIIYVIVIKAGSSTAIRSYTISQGWGDVYYFGSVFMTRVQLQGNALLVMACITAFYKKDKLIYRIGLLLACLIAGNKAFLIGLFLFASYFCLYWIFATKKNYNFDFKVCALILCAIVATPILIDKVNSILEEKSGYSNAVRYEQAEILLSGNIISGNGVGNTVIGKSAHREYNGGDYFEVQTLFIINQIGIIGYFLFLILTFGLCLQTKNQVFVCFVYFTYLAYTFFNPYCFDTTHMITGFLLCSVFNSKKWRILK